MIKNLGVPLRLWKLVDYKNRFHGSLFKFFCRIFRAPLLISVITSMHHVVGYTCSCARKSILCECKYLSESTRPQIFTETPNTECALHNRINSKQALNFETNPKCQFVYSAMISFQNMPVANGFGIMI